MERDEARARRKFPPHPSGQLPPRPPRPADTPRTPWSPHSEPGCLVKAKHQIEVLHRRSRSTFAQIV